MLFKKYLPQVNYLQNFAGFPIYNHTKTQYLPSGEAKFKAMLDEIEKSKKNTFF